MGTIFVAGEFSNELLDALLKEHRVVLPRDLVPPRPIWYDLFIIHEEEASCDLLCWAAMNEFRVPALVVGRDDREALLRRLEQGASVYVRENIGAREVLAHVKSLLRRQKISAGWDSS